MTWTHIWIRGRGHVILEYIVVVDPSLSFSPLYLHHTRSVSLQWSSTMNTLNNLDVLSLVTHVSNAYSYL